MTNMKSRRLLVAISLLVLLQCASSYEDVQFTCIGKETDTDKKDLTKQFLDAYEVSHKAR
jgi:hypothetical protein